MPTGRKSQKCFYIRSIAGRDAENWVERGRERPTASLLPLALVAPAHVLSETKPSTGIVLTEYCFGLNRSPKEDNNEQIENRKRRK